MSIAPIDRLNACRSASEFRHVLGELCGDIGEAINVTVLCGQDQETAMCVIDFRSGTASLSEIARRLSGQLFGLSSVVINFKQPDDFVCPKGLETTPSACSCTFRK